MMHNNFAYLNAFDAMCCLGWTGVCNNNCRRRRRWCVPSSENVELFAASSSPFAIRHRRHSPSFAIRRGPVVVLVIPFLLYGKNQINDGTMLGVRGKTEFGRGHWKKTKTIA
mmetsp:Transcript_31786/g.77164  ORF Transcript_31786/g.77164 Transcript_31786/m.77164 type:complete len:112 (-) Transcript_31786:621-956(-)